MKHVLPIISTLFLFVLGCQETTTTSAEEPTVQVHLPESPKMEIPTIVERHADGSYTVEGLIFNRATALNSTIRVSGFIQRKYVCKPDQQACDTPSHAVLVDDVASPKQRLIVVGGETTIFSDLKDGERVTLDAHYGLHDPKALFVRTEGVLILPHVDQPEAEPTPSP